jgi:hypothetical protein
LKVHPGKSFFLTAFLLLILLACGPLSTSSGDVPPPDGIPVTGATPTASLIQHQAIPAELPGERSGHAGDQDSSPMADKKRAPSGDRFTFDQFERPFNADTMDVYFPYLDIQDVLVYQDDTWAYAVITVKGRDADDALPGKYALELDLDQDGRGDWFIMVSHPASADWTTDGVQAWSDANNDVGGSTVVTADKAISTGDGYETLSNDPDGAWARIAPGDPNSIQLAAKLSLLGGDKAYLAGMWTGNEDLNPALFDLNDHFTHEQAGAALPELEYFYPIKQLSELDNTCRLAVGFAPTGNEPGICAVNIPGACQPPPGGCDAASGFHWNKKLCCCEYYDLGCNYSP